VSSPNGQFLDCATIAISDRYMYFVLKKTVCSAILINLAKNSLNPIQMRGANLIENTLSNCVLTVANGESSPDHTIEGHLTQCGTYDVSNFLGRDGHTVLSWSQAYNIVGYVRSIVNFRSRTTDNCFNLPVSVISDIQLHLVYINVHIHTRKRFCSTKCRLQESSKATLVASLRLIDRTIVWTCAVDTMRKYFGGYVFWITY